MPLTRRQTAKLVAASLLAPTLARAAFARAAEPHTPIRLSFMLWALTRQAPFDHALEIVSAAGYQGVELVGEFQKWSPEQTRTNLARLRSLNLVVDSMSGVKAGFAVPDDTPAFRQQFTQHLTDATTLACPQVILLSGKRIEALTPQAQLDCALENLKWAADQAARAHIEVVIEPIDFLENPSIYLATVTDAFKIARTLNHPSLKVLYDLYHEQRSFGNLTEKLEANIASIGLIHIADVPGRHQPGTGEIDFPAIYRTLARLHYDRWIAMEYYPTPNPAQDPIATLRQSRTELLAAFR